MDMLRYAKIRFSAFCRQNENPKEIFQRHLMLKTNGGTERQSGDRKGEASLPVH
jgi:hypothetical protein